MGGGGGGRSSALRHIVPLDQEVMCYLCVVRSELGHISRLRLGEAGCEGVAGLLP